MEEALFQRQPCVDWMVGVGTVHITPFEGDRIDLAGVQAIIWSVLERPRTWAELLTEVWAVDPLLDEAVVRETVDEMVGVRTVARSVRDIAV